MSQTLLNINEDGFTYVMDGFIILLDLPLERLKNDPDLAYQTLEKLHDSLLNSGTRVLAVNNSKEDLQ